MLSLIVKESVDVGQVHSMSKDVAYACNNESGCNLSLQIHPNYNFATGNKVSNYTPGKGCGGMTEND